jgi:UDP-N-acetylglucosamine--N-acetylmuramyl-(pentapeptide) pyrophosphoryl-undecaprenol N-acetylglucosamine transferase
MPDVIAASDVILSRAGANSIWECATLGKPMVLVPLCGSGTRGDQEDNASFFEKSGGAFVLARENATSEKLKECLDVMSDASKRQAFVQANYSLTKNTNPAEKIANLIYNEFNL